MTPTAARLAQIIELAERADSHTCDRIRELASRALADERAAARERDAVIKFAGLKARQCADAAFGDSRVEDAGRAFEDIASMLERLGWEAHGTDGVATGHVDLRDG